MKFTALDSGPLHRGCPSPLGGPELTRKKSYCQVLRLPPKAIQINFPIPTKNKIISTHALPEWKKFHNTAACPKVTRSMANSIRRSVQFSHKSNTN